VFARVSAGQARSIQPSLRAEAESLLESAGYTVPWRQPGERSDAEIVVMMQFVGDCSAPAPQEAAHVAH
jgi:hypothetical protein